MQLNQLAKKLISLKQIYKIFFRYPLWTSAQDFIQYFIKGFTKRSVLGIYS